MSCWVQRPAFPPVCKRPNAAGCGDRRPGSGGIAFPFTKEEKLSLITFLWDVAYADSILDVDEERLVRRIADLIRVKDIDVLKLKDRAKN